MSNARDLETVLARFPKSRPPLPPKLQAIYTRQYKENRPSQAGAQRLHTRSGRRWLHRQVAAGVRRAPRRHPHSP